MTLVLVSWILNALSLMIVASVVPGFRVSGFGTALLAALIFSLVNGTLGFVLKVLTFPVTILTLGLFLLVINALMLQVAAAVVPGFSVRGFAAAFLGAVVLALIHLVLRMILGLGE
jgi:putative membrane protein